MLGKRVLIDLKFENIVNVFVYVYNSIFVYVYLLIKGFQGGIYILNNNEIIGKNFEIDISFVNCKCM